MKHGKMEVTQNEQYNEFSLCLAIVDLLPVLFFCGSCIVVSQLFKSYLFFIGAAFCIIAGCGKVLWKLILSLAQKNLFLFNSQLRVFLPAGFFLILISIIVNHDRISLYLIWQGISSFPSVCLFVIGSIGIILMTVFAKKMNGASVQANWIEQITNTIAQAAFFIGLLLM